MSDIYSFDLCRECWADWQLSNSFGSCAWTGGNFSAATAASKTRSSGLGHDQQTHVLFFARYPQPCRRACSRDVLGLIAEFAVTAIERHIPIVRREGHRRNCDTGDGGRWPSSSQPQVAKVG